LGRFRNIDPRRILAGVAIGLFGLVLISSLVKAGPPPAPWFGVLVLSLVLVVFGHLPEAFVSRRWSRAVPWARSLPVGALALGATAALVAIASTLQPWLLETLCASLGDRNLSLATGEISARLATPCRRFAELFWGVLCTSVLMIALVVFLRHRRHVFPWLPVLAAITSVTAAVSAILMLGDPSNPFTILYRAAQLFTGQGGWTEDELELVTNPTIGFLLHLARLAALVATLSALLALFRNINDWLQVRLAVKEGHTLLCGLGEGGYEFVRQWSEEVRSGQRRAAEPLLVIERDPENPNIESVRNMGYPVMVGDVFDKRVLRQARATRARHIIHMLPDDKRNVELALLIRRQFASAERRRRAPVRWLVDRLGGDSQHTTKLLIHVDDTRLARRAQAHGRLRAEDLTETRFFDFYESSARRLLRDHSLERYAAIQDAPQPHLAIYGLGQMGEAVLRQAVLMCAHPEGHGLAVTVFDRRVGHGLKEGFWRRHPGLHRLVRGDDDYRPADVKVNFLGLADARQGISAERLMQSTDGHTLPPPTQHFVCFDADELSATFSLSLRDTLRNMCPSDPDGGVPLAWGAPVFLRLKRRQGLAGLFLETPALATGRPLNTPDSMFPFGMLDEVVNPTELIDEARDRLAETLHEDGYRAIRGRIPPVQNIWRKESGVPWSSLPLHYKASNRAQADHVARKLESIGCTIRPPTLKALEDGDRWRPLRHCQDPVERMAFEPDRHGWKLTSVQQGDTTGPVVAVWSWHTGDTEAKLDQAHRYRLQKRWWSRLGRRRWRRVTVPYTSGLRVGGPREATRGAGNAGNAELTQLQDAGRARLRVTREGQRERSLELPAGAVKVEAQREAYPFLLVRVRYGVNNASKPEWLLWCLDLKPGSGPVSVDNSSGHDDAVLVPGPNRRRCAVDLPPSSDGSVQRRLCLVDFKAPKAQRLVQLDFSEAAVSSKMVAFSRDGELLLAVCKGTGEDREAVCLGWSSLTQGAAPSAARFTLPGLQHGCSAIDRFQLADQQLYCLGSYDDQGRPAVFIWRMDNDSARETTVVPVCMPAPNGDRAEPLVFHAAISAFAYQPSDPGAGVEDALAIGCKDGAVLVVRGVMAWLCDVEQGAAESAQRASQHAASGLFNPDTAPAPLELMDPWLRMLRIRRIAETDKNETEGAHGRDWGERLAQVEHDRWSMFHLLDNWRYDPTRVDAARTHGNLCAWKHLDVGTRNFDAAHVAGLPRFIENADVRMRAVRQRRVCQEVRVGLVGHRAERLKAAGLEWLFDAQRSGGEPDRWSKTSRDELKSLRDRLQEMMRPRENQLPVRAVLVSPLAEGADRALTYGLMDPKIGLGGELLALLPLPWEIYYKTFSQDAEENKRSIDEFGVLIARSSTHLELPMRFGNLHDLGTQSENPDKWPTKQQKQFQLANAWIAQHCDYLVAAWDGSEIGSTTETIGSDLGLLKLDADPALAFTEKLDQRVEKLYSEVARPGGTWEAVRWWLEPSRIPLEMRWHQRYRRSPWCENDSAQAGAQNRARRLVFPVDHTSSQNNSSS